MMSMTVVNSGSRCAVTLGMMATWRLMLGFFGGRFRGLGAAVLELEQFDLLFQRFLSRSERHTARTRRRTVHLRVRM